MLRAPGSLAARLCSRAPLARRPMTTLPVPAFSEVKFQKEDVNKVMLEVPEFNFYEMKEPAPNPYAGITMDQSVVLDPVAPKLVAPAATFSKLENGLRIASLDRQGLTAHVGLYVHCGSRYETAANFGASHMAALMAFKSTAHLSHLRTVKTLETLGSQLASTCTAGREEIAYRVDVGREHMPLVLPLIIGNVLFPRLLPWEVKAAQPQVKEARAALLNNPDAMVSELLHQAAFCNNTLGLSPLAAERALPNFTPETVRNFMLDHFAPERMVLAAVNVDHGELAKWAMRSFVDYNAIPKKAREEAKAQYTGGDVRADGPSPFCHLAIGLESVPWGSKDLAAASLLQTILGQGSAVVKTPGGNSGRLSEQVLGQSSSVEAVSAFNTTYTDSGLFGVYGVCAPGAAGELAKAMTTSLTGLTKATAPELARAKSVLKGRLLRQADDSAALVQDMGQQILMSGAYGGAGDLASLVDGVTEADVSRVAAALLQSRPSVAAFGDTHTVPHYSAVEAALQGP